ncbi:LAFE_0G01684g1_1 [Lachancea fermentati]|uniref:LAFE_0G01684g1_1 n=1 Tax=Lachancea fermentati TaxID=4955 RepID=A0A1G4MGK4_LACFM|nr:LAFE_0G01684g1_1 [Lachancea fermentati]
MNQAINIAKTSAESLATHEIVPDVIKSSFSPWGLLAAEYAAGSPVAMGNTLTIDETQAKPKVHFTLDPQSQFEIRDSDLFTLVITDPDAPSRSDHKWSEYCHYVEADIRMPFAYSRASSSAVPDFVASELAGGHVLADYVGPAPPKGTGKHRYVLLLYKQSGPASQLSKIADRPNWGYGAPATGAHRWAAENGLELVAANFFYAENK